MTALSLNYLSILLAAVGSWLLGMAWYMGLAKPWMAATEKTEAQLMGPDGKPSPVPFVVSFLLQILMAAVLYGILTHLGEFTVRRGIISGALCWLGFVLPAIMTNNLYQKKPFLLTIIDAGYFLGVLVIQGAVLGWFGR